jgi:hypothetical protein
MVSYRNIQRNIDRIKQNKPDWHYRIGVWCSLIVIIICIVLLIKIVTNI